MIYTTTERNNAIRLIANGKADFSNTAFYERLEEFNWIIIRRSNGIINGVELTYAGKDLFNRLRKQDNNINN
jgi:hypothetical protein